MKKICPKLEILAHNLELLIVEIPVDELAAMETKAVTQAHSLKCEANGFRYFLARCTPAQGETHQVYVDAFLPPGPAWIGVHKYAPFAPSKGTETENKAPWE
jgi:hypothetical protein